VDDGRVDDRAGRQPQPMPVQMLVHGLEDGSAQIVPFQQMADLAD
jgi:hypothetical protein